MEYYLPTLEANAIQMRRTNFSDLPLHHQPSTSLTIMDSPLPFTKCGVNILGPFPKETR